MDAGQSSRARVSTAPSSPVELIPVTLLTGFLGSGKTTLLNHLVRQPELADALVIINEFGAMALDHKLVAHSTDNVIMEMSSGCLCCTIRGDLVQTLRDITWRFAREGKRQFSRVLIETTGLADPAPILHTLMTHPHIASRYRLDGIVTTVDCATGMQTLDQHPESVKQAAVADVILLTKADLVPAAQRQALEQRLVRINPAATRTAVPHGIIAPTKLLNLGLFKPESKIPDVAAWLKAECYASNTATSSSSATTHLPEHTSSQHAEPAHQHHHDADHAHAHDHDHDHDHDINRHDDHIRAFCFELEEPIAEHTLNAWLELLMSFVGSHILRVKGILNVAGNPRPVVIHGVQHIFHPPVTLPAWPSDDRRSRVVFITQDVEKATIERTFAALHNA